MADIGDKISKIESLLEKRGFRVDSTGIEKDFAWKPDILVAREDETQAFLVRQTGSVPISLVERLASTKPKKRNLFINIVFLNKATPEVRKTLSLYGLGIQRLDGSKLVEIAKSKNFLPVKEPKKLVVQHKKMMKTEIFISSQQKILERKTARDVIEDIYNRDRFPVYPFQVEDDPRFGGSPAETKKCIDEGLDKCDWFVGILSDEWRRWVDYEVRQAIKKSFDDKDITIYVKSTRQTEIAWSKLLTWTKKRSIKYLPYSHLQDLKTKLAGRILGKIERVHRKLGIPMYNS